MTKSSSMACSSLNFSSATVICSVNSETLAAIFLKE